jgi:hypothetical protein
MGFQMQIDDVFHLSSGFTIFCGLVDGTEELIKFGQKAELFIDGLFYRIIETHGEWIGTPENLEGKRAISTLNTIDLTSEFVKQHNCVLISIEDL